MKGYSYFCIAVAALMMISGVAHANYWFQSGVVGSPSAGFNSGASVDIQTISPQNIGSGSLAFWTGETLSNGAFLQVGYLVENSTGYYPSVCGQSGCTNEELIHAGDAEWFYEYFPPSGASQFYGQIGPDGSAGANGSVNTYGFYYSDDAWHFTFDKSAVGLASLGSSESGSVAPVAFAELANTTVNTETIIPVIFSNFSVYNYGSFTPVSKGLSYIGYGDDSAKGLHNPYGVEELDNRADYFEVGSGLQQPANNTQMWSTSFNLDISSAYGNLSQVSQYIGYSKVGISAPMYVQLNGTARERFLGWTGTGPGSYTGPDNLSIISMNGNVTETARWQRQYLANVTTNYGNVSGGGWYDNDSTATFALSGRDQNFGTTNRVVFVDWSDGQTNFTISQRILGPLSLDAVWERQYLVNATSEYGKVSGNGWYDIGSTAQISLNTTMVAVGAGERYMFYNWSDGNSSSTRSILVSAPIEVHANFLLEYLVSVQSEDSQGNPINVSGFYVDNVLGGSSIFLYANSTYNITAAYYKGAVMQIGKQITVLGPETLDLKLPVYNVTVYSRGILGLPSGGELHLKFANGTMENLSIGASGVLTIPEVPFGYMNGTESTGVFVEAVKAQGEQSVSLVSLSIIDIGIMAAAVVIAAAALIMWHLARRRYHGFRR